MSKPHYKPIGYIRTRHSDRVTAPPSSTMNQERGELHLYKKYAAGLKGLGGFSHLLVIWHMHKSTGEYKLQVHPRPKPEIEVGVFTTRAPHRPNPIGLSLIEVERVKDNVIYFRGVDMLDRTPVLDIKPPFSNVKSLKRGWLEKT